jgi:hypothetical protein
MTIELDDKSYIVGVWYSSDPETLNNWLSCVIRNPDNPKTFKCWSRFRYVKGDKIFDGEDEKNWTTFISNEGHSESDLIALMRDAQEEIAPGYPDKDKIIVKGNLEKLMRLAKDKDWMHLKTERIQ